MELRVLPKIAAHWVLSCFRAGRRIRSYSLFLHRKQHLPPSTLQHSNVTNCALEGREAQTLLCDFNGSLLTSPSLFPFFMLIAFEGGSLIRALALLVSSPIIFALGHRSKLSLKIMTFVTFFGLRTKDMDLVARVVLPKFYLEGLHLCAYEVFASMGRRVVVTGMPRVMVEGFVRGYLSASEVVGAELKVVRGTYYTGFMAESGSAVKQRAIRELFGECKADVSLVSPSNLDDHLFIPYSKESFNVGKGDSPMPRNRYPKPLFFHDGRLAFLPTPSATLALFLWLPLGISLAAVRIMSGPLLPYKASAVVAGLTGLRLRVRGLPIEASSREESAKGVLYVCTHRTLLDPVMLSIILGKSVPAVTYSLSRMSEILAPMRTVRLTRDRLRDAKTIGRMLEEGDLAVCPEGTTCREPYLLRFSSLFAELTEDIVPVAIEAKGSMLHGTTASGFKWLDPILFLANPAPEYRLEFLGRIPREMTCAAGRTGSEVANRVQRQLADALGFECTTLTRRDKYLMLAGNEGVVHPTE